LISLDRRGAALVAVLTGSLAAASPAGDYADGLSFDLLIAARHALSPESEPRPSGAVVAVVMDEATYQQPPFRDLPRALWAPFHAAVLDALLDAGTAAVGYDFVFVSSTETMLKDYDRSFRVSLRRAAMNGQVVLGAFQGGPGLQPHPSYVFSVGGTANVRPLDIVPDPDGVVRSMPLELGSDGDRVASFAAELAARAGALVDGTPGGRIRLDIAGARRSVPAYSFADLHRCATVEANDFFEQHFQGRIVIIGADLAIEDRHQGANRFIAPPPETGPAACSPRPLEGAVPLPGTTAGVYFQASAVDQLLTQTHLREAGTPLGCALVIGFALLGAVPPLLAQTRRFAHASHLLMPVIAGLGIISLAQGLVLPTGRVLLAALLGYIIAFLYRIGLMDRDRWRLRRTLGLYLPQPELERLHASGALPELGGETRELTVMFVDVANFTAFAESHPPAEVTAALNAHFDRLANIVEEHGGIVDRYVGDAVIALFGAPVAYADHAGRAVAAALAVTSEHDPQHAAGDGPGFAIRIGLATGPALVGNIGSRRRFNYTAIGDTVNLAARIEGMNKVYGSRILVQNRTAEACAGIAFREVDRVRVVGRAQPIELFEPLAEPETEDAILSFAQALELYRSRDFAEAVTLFQRLAERDPVARTFLARCRALLLHPPSPDWDGTHFAEAK
jgi:adenylate cyclase